MSAAALLKAYRSRALSPVEAIQDVLMRIAAFEQHIQATYLLAPERALEEARAYLAHPVLGPRLVLCTEAVLAIRGKSLHDIFGSPDDMKFPSSMTLFTLASDDPGNVFKQALEAYCGGNLDERTLTLLEAGPRYG